MLKTTLAAAAVLGGLMIPATASAATSAIVTADLNIRTGPGTGYQRFGTIPYGSHVTVIGCLSGYSWCDVSWAGERGWVSSNYLAYRVDGYDPRPISSVAVSIGVPIIAFEPYDYHARWYRDRDWYSDRYIRREWREDRREDRREWRAERRDDRRDVRAERRDVRQDRRDVRELRREVREARRDGENARPIRRELRQERRELRQERRELRQERRDIR